MHHQKCEEINMISPHLCTSAERPIMWHSLHTSTRHFSTSTYSFSTWYNSCTIWYRLSCCKMEYIGYRFGGRIRPAPGSVCVRGDVELYPDSLVQFAFVSFLAKCRWENLTWTKSWRYSLPAPLFRRFWAILYKRWEQTSCVSSTTDSLINIWVFLENSYFKQPETSVILSLFMLTKLRVC